MELKFGVTVADQLSIEKEIKFVTLADLGCPTAFNIYPKCWKEYYARFVLRHENMPIEQICLLDRVGARKEKLTLKQKL